MNSNKNNTILLIEQSDNLRTVLKDFLEMKQFDVKDFSDGLQALKSMSKFHYDLCILDLMATPVNGFYLIHEIKKSDHFIPVVFISSKGDKETRIKGFKEGCDDFITKPFSIEELELRVEAIIRRTGSKVNNNDDFIPEVVYYFADFKFNYTTLELIHPLRTFQLTKKEAEILQLLCSNVNVVITRQRFVKEIWGEDKAHMGRSMDVYITRLRKYLSIQNQMGRGGKTDKNAPLKIVNVHGTGYILKMNE